MSGASRHIAVVASMLLLAGCGPKVLLQPPTDWPGRWGGRKLFHTPNAYIYADSAAAAAEADRLVAIVGDHLTERTGVKPVKGLVIVTDFHGSLGNQDVRSVFKAFLCSRIRKKGKPTPGPQEIDRAWAAIDSPEAAKAGIDVKLALLISATGIDREDISAVLGLPEATAGRTHWAAAVPTRALIEEFLSQTLDAAFRDKKMSLTARLALKPLLALLRPAMVDSVAAKREIVLYEQHVRGQPDWSAERKQKEIKAYEADNEEQLKDRFKSLVPTVPGRSTTRPEG